MPENRPPSQPHPQQPYGPQPYPQPPYPGPLPPPAAFRPGAAVLHGPPLPPRPPHLGERMAAAWPAPLQMVPTATVALVLTAAAVAGLFLPGARPGIGIFVVGALLAAATVPAGLAGSWAPARRRQTALFAAATIGLMAVPAVRAAGWVGVLSLFGAALLGTVALAGGTTWRALTAAPLSLPWAALRMHRWRFGDGRLSALARSGAPRAALLTLAAVVLFGALFAAADGIFAGVVDAVLPDLDAALLPFQVVVFCFVLVLAAAAAYLAASPPQWDEVTVRAPKRWRRAEWLVPLAAVNLMFAAFLAVQLSALLGGREYVEQRTGLTYAEYARQGFWQLLVVTVLTLIVVAVAARRAPSAEPSDRLVVRTVLAALCAQCLLVVASALGRMHLYQEEFGFTRLRLLVSWFSVELGVVLALVLAAVVLGRGTWLPRAVVASGAGALLVLAAVNPDGYIAGRNVDRYQRAEQALPGSGKIDLDYLRGLSADAVPAISRLPEELRTPALGCTPARLGEPDSWAGWNLGRARARALVSPSDGASVCSVYGVRQ